MINAESQLNLEKKLNFYRLSQSEYQLMRSLLGREPQDVEWPIFSALWSEHCSYKSSKKHLKKFSYRNVRTPDLEGENAGVVDLGMGEKIAFKMESHNHPSFIEPVQGAATGVGGILRDIFTMGARPIMSANYLCFGEVTASRMKYLVDGVIKGISSYGNCVGVPTVTGQTNFHKKYNKNILVNALSVGYFGPQQPMALSKAQGVGNLVVYVGAKTGRDGVHGAAMASASFDEDSDLKKPNVQIGDPFFEKLLIEACLEVLQKNYVAAMQDMGAAGLTSSSFEMASKGGVGLVMDLKKVPLRDSSMGPEEILLSESQERMLVICKPENFENLKEVFKKWSFDAVILGEVQKEKKIKLMWGSEVLTEIDPDLLVEQAPRYDRAYNAWEYQNRVDKLPENNSLDVFKFTQHLMKNFKLNHFDWLHSQYDQRVGTRTAKGCESSVAFARLDHSGRGLALAVGCRPELMLMDAKIGAYDAVYYPAFQMALKGAEVLALTDCLNFGNPQRPEIMSEFVASVEAIADAAKKLEAPVISGNVSFYNETLSENIISTPAVGAVGLRADVNGIVNDRFNDEGLSIFKVSLNWVLSDTYISDEFTKTAKFQLNEEADVPQFIRLCRELSVKADAVKAIGLGGIAVTCLKMCSDKIGFELDAYENQVRESQMFVDELYGFLICLKGDDSENISKLTKHFNLKHISVEKIGVTKKETMIFNSRQKLEFRKIQRDMSAGFEKAGVL